MIPVPYSVMNNYVAMLSSREIPPAHVEYYKKWLRYFYDFSVNNQEMNDKSEKVKLFLEKLRSRKQTPIQCQQAAHAVALYFEMQNLEMQQVKSVVEASKEQNPVIDMLPSPSLSPDPSALTAPLHAFKQRQSQYSEAGYQEKSDSLEWDKVLEAMATEIKVRHYSRKTLQTYAKWSRNFQRFLKNKPPDTLTTEDVKEYLAFLAVKCKVAASTKTRRSTRCYFSFGTG